jgi:hypothetical protein
MFATLARTTPKPAVMESTAAAPCLPFRSSSATRAASAAAAAAAAAPEDFSATAARSAAAACSGQRHHPSLAAIEVHAWLPTREGGCLGWRTCPQAQPGTNPPGREYLLYGFKLDRFISAWHCQR